MKYALFDFNREVTGVFSHLFLFVIPSYLLLQSSTAIISGLYFLIASFTSIILSLEI